MAAPPSAVEFLSFLQNVAGFRPAVLPPDSPVIATAYDLSLAMVNKQLPLNIYSLAFLNLGADTVARFAPDQDGQTFFKDLRQSLKINAFTPGVTQSASDEGTSESLATPEFMQRLTLSDLQNLKTPWGLQYLAFAQMYGGLWGLS